MNEKNSYLVTILIETENQLSVNNARAIIEDAVLTGAAKIISIEYHKVDSEN